MRISAAICHQRSPKGPFSAGSAGTMRPPGGFWTVLRPSRQRAEAAGLMRSSVTARAGSMALPIKGGGAANGINELVRRGPRDMATLESEAADGVAREQPPPATVSTPSRSPTKWRSTRPTPASTFRPRAPALEPVY